jgi:hypothetical protein
LGLLLLGLSLLGLLLLARRHCLKVKRVGLTLQFLGMTQQVLAIAVERKQGRQSARVHRFASFGLCGEV